MGGKIIRLKMEVKVGVGELEAKWNEDCLGDVCMEVGAVGDGKRGTRGDG